MNAILKQLPCRLDSVESLIPYLTPTSRGVISDDSSGFMHVHLHRESRKLCGFHVGGERYYFNCLPFGIPTGKLKNHLIIQITNSRFPTSQAPSVYQSLNSVITTLLRQYGVPNCLYIGEVYFSNFR